MEVLKNRRAYHEYEILEKFEAGLELKGFEVKAIKSGRGSLVGARVIIRGNEAYIVGMDIPPYQPANTPKNYDPQATRRLLLKKKEIVYLGGRSNEAGLTLIPLGIYTKKGFLKLSLAVCKGLKKYDKRARIKEREAERKIDREMKESV